MYTQGGAWWGVPRAWSLLCAHPQLLSKHGVFLLSEAVLF